MLAELKFVQGAVAKKDFIPSLTHFEIKNRTIKGFNGSLALCAPIDVELDIKPRAVPFVKAIQGCKGNTVQLTVTKTGRLSIKAGKFKALVECTDEEFPTVDPEGDWVSLEGIDFIPALKKLLDFTGEDASRRWSLGILFRGSKAYATNNIVLMEYDLGVHFPVEINVPKTAVAELIRIGKPPVGIKLSTTSVTFMYDQNHWIKTQLYDLGWPDLNRVLSRETEMVEVQESWFDAVESVSPFVDELSRVYFKDSTITTVSENDAAGGTVEMEDFPYCCVFNHKYFMSLRGVISHIDLNAYPAPCLFKGPNVRGALMGMKSA